MSRKDYVAIAAAFREIRELGVAGEDPAMVLTALQNRIADVLGGDNSRFDRDRFWVACYPETDA